MHKMGIPDEHIIVFMYDDIAQNSQNPMKFVNFILIFFNISSNTNKHTGGRSSTSPTAPTCTQECRTTTPERTCRAPTSSRF